MKKIGKPAHVATGDTDMSAEPKRGLKLVRSEKETVNKKPENTRN